MDRDLERLLEQIDTRSIDSLPADYRTFLKNRLKTIYAAMELESLGLEIPQEAKDLIYEYQRRNMNITMQGKYQTKEGRPVRILCVDRKGSECSVIGLVVFPDGSESVNFWTLEGKCWTSNGPNAADLVPVPTKHEAWCVIDSSVPLFTTRELAEKKHAELHIWPSSHVAHVTWED